MVSECVVPSDVVLEYPALIPPLSPIVFPIVFTVLSAIEKPSAPFSIAPPTTFAPTPTAARGATIGNAVPTTVSTEPAIEIALPASATLFGLVIVVLCETSEFLDAFAPILIPRLFV